MRVSDEFEIRHDGKEYHVVVTAIITVDNDYGADADGNRGCRAEWIEIEDLLIEDENGIDVTDQMRDVLNNAIEDKIGDE